MLSFNSYTGEDYSILKVWQPGKKLFTWRNFDYLLYIVLKTTRFSELKYVSLLHNLEIAVLAIFQNSDIVIQGVFPDCCTKRYDESTIDYYTT